MPQPALEQLKAPPLGTTIAGRYRLVRFLGAGGMAAVYDALTTEGARVAVKVLLGSASRSEEQLARFWREAQLTSQLEEPHIVPTLDFGLDQSLGVPYLVMPLMVGCDLERLIKTSGALQPTVAVRIACQACRALATAHAAGVIHRDIKPANIFLDQDIHGVVTVRVLDFGFAKVQAQRLAALTKTDSLLGTPDYWSPEHVLDIRKADARTDLWSLGITLFQALSGQLPFEANSLGELCIALNTTSPRPLQELAPWVDPGLARIVHGCLLRQPQNRCPSAVELTEALGPFADGSEQIDVAMFVPLEPQLRAWQAARCQLPETWLREPPEGELPPISSAPHDPLLGRFLAQRFRLLRRIDEGGMGSVYEAQTNDGARYAVKVIKPALAGKSSSARKRFVREAKATTSIRSENVVQVLDADTDAEQPFIVMEMLHGLDLEQSIDQHGALAPKAVAKVFLQACRGLGAAHQSQLVHRDVKPGNLFLHQEPSGLLTVKVCDFGIVKRLGGEAGQTKLTSTGSIIGSPIYMSPEQALDAKDVDLRSDIWSLGASLYEALSGELAFNECETIGQLIVAICDAPI